MNLPIESLTSSYREIGLVVAVVIGFGFGFVLERAGFGRATKLAAQFYGHDMTVLKVMFGAIVTALLGAVIASRLGLIDLHALSTGAVSATYIWPMLVGGFLLGIGFVVSGYCPGTSLVSSASGNIDGMVALLGIVVGSALYGEIFPLIDDFHASGDQGQIFLYQLLNVPPAVVAAAVAVMAIGAFLGAERIEAIFRRKFAAAAQVLEKSAPERPKRGFALGAMATGAAVALLLLFSPLRLEAEPRMPARVIDAEYLAHRVLEEPWKLRILDTRPRKACVEARVPGAECAPAATLGDLGLAFAPGDRDLVLVGEASLTEIPPAAAEYKGDLLILEDGFAAWRAFALEKPKPPAASATAKERERYRFQAAVNQALTGSVAPSSPPPAATPYVPKKKKEGGCD